MARQDEGDKVCVGTITGAHGVRGLVKIKSFTEDPADLVAYGPVSDRSGKRRFMPELLSQAKGQWIARLDGVTDRDAAQALARTQLFVERSALPAIEEEGDAFYHADLIGLVAVDGQGTTVGKVTAVYDFGSGDVLEIAPSGGGLPLMVPFTQEAVPSLDIADGRLTVLVPEELVAGEEDA
ncbi:MAG: ribosome maturation factor RimM [Pseudomonadota bacterium]